MKHCTSAITLRLFSTFCLSFLLFFPTGLEAATRTWLGTTDELWERASNWSGNAVPGAADDVVIPGVSSGIYPEIGDTRSAKSVSIQSGASLEIVIGGTLNISGAGGDGMYILGNFTNKGDLYINNVGGDGIHINANAANVLLRSKTYIGNSGNIGAHGIYIQKGSLNVEDINDGDFRGLTLLNIDNTANNGIYNFGGSIKIDEVNSGLFTSRTTVNIGTASSTSIGTAGILNAASFELEDGTVNVLDAGGSNPGVVHRFILTASPLFRIQSRGTLNIGGSSNKLPERGLLNEDDLVVIGKLNIENTTSHGLYNRVTTIVGGSAIITIVNADGHGIYNYDDFTNNGTINLGATSKPVDLDGIRNERLSGTNDDVDFINNGTVNIKNVLDNGIRNMQTADFTNTGTITIGEIQIGLSGIINDDNGSAFVNDGGTIRINFVGAQAGSSALDKIALRVEDLGSFNNLGGGIIEIGQGVGSIPGTGIFVRNNNTVFNNTDGQIKIDKVGSAAIAMELGGPKVNNRANGEILIGQGIGNVGGNGISMVAFTGGITNEGTIKIDNCGDNGLFMTGDVDNQGSGELIIGQNGGNITNAGISIVAGAAFTNKGDGKVRVDNVGGASIDASSSTVNNEACASMKLYDRINKSGGSFLNEGYLMIKTNNSHTVSGGLVNNGILQYGLVNPIPGLTNNDLLIHVLASGVCALSPVFEEGAANDFDPLSNGTTWYLEESLSTAVGTYDAATNSFNFDLTNFPTNQENIYFNISGNGCTHLIDIEYNPYSYSPVIPNRGKLTWTGESTTAWENPCNWLPVRVPTTADDIIIPTSTSYPVIANGIVAEGKSLVMETDTRLTIDFGGSLALDGASGIGADIDGRLTNNGTFSVDNTGSYGIILASRSADFLSRGDVLIGQSGPIGDAGIRLEGQGNFTINDNGSGTTDLDPTLLIDNTNSHGISSNFGQIQFKGITSSTVQIIVRIGALGTNSINGSAILLSNGAYTEIRGTEVYIDNALNGLQHNSGTFFYDFNSYLEVGGSGNTIPGVGVSNNSIFNFTNGIIKVSNTGSSAIRGNNRFNTNPGSILQIEGEIANVTSITGLLSPGSSPGIVTTDGDLNIINATLEIEIDGTTQGVDYDWLDVGGIANLGSGTGGTLKPVINYVPNTGDRITFLTATTITGTFNTIDPLLPAGWGLDYSIPGEVSLLFDPTIFPVEFLEFEAEVLGQSTLLNWATASELNNDGFEVEHSSEGSLWGKIGFVSGVGTSDEVNTYEFRHLEPQPGSNYYRLKQIDFDGNYEYSKVLEVNVTPFAQGISIYPNPASDRLTIELLRSFTRGKLQVFDLKGQLIYQSSLDENQASMSLQTQNWASGAYQLIIQVDNSLYTSKFMLSR